MSDNETRRAQIEEVEALTLRLLDGEAEEAELRRLEQLLAADDELERVHLGLLEQEATLRGERGGLDLTAAVMARVRSPERARRIERNVMERLRGREGERSPGARRDRWRWLGGARFWKVSAAAAALLLVALGAQTGWIMTRQALPQEAFVYGQARIVPGRPAAFRVHVRDASLSRPIAGAEVRAALLRRGEGGESGAVIWRAQARSDDRGVVLLRPAVGEAVAEGDYTLEVRAVSARGESLVDHPLQIRRSYKVMITTDKPLYQPGQTIRIRTLSLGSGDLRPARGRPVVIEIKDAKENKIFKRQVRTSRFGIAAAELALADQVNLGRYTVSATLGDTESVKNVEIKRYQLPKFRLELQTDRAFYGPGDMVRGALVARYTFGQPVARAQVVLRGLEQVEALKPFYSISGVTDAEGRLAFELPLRSFFVGQPIKQGDAVVFLEARVTDPAHHTQVKSLELTVTERPIRVELLPEGLRLVPGVDNTVYVITAYPDGRPAQTTLQIDGDPGLRATQGLRSSKLGIAAFILRPGAMLPRVHVVAADAQGRRVELTRELPVNKRSDAFLLRTDRVVYQAGQTVRLAVLSPASSDRERVFVDVIRDGRALLVQAVDVRQGRGALALDLPPDAFGALQLHAYRVGADGDLTSDTRLIQVLRPDQLRIEAELDRASYRPAEQAVLKLAVRRAGGQPVVAALGLAGVDEAVFALHELRPGLARIYFTLQQELLKPRYEMHARAPYDPAAALQSGPPRDAESQAASRAFFAAAGSDQPLLRRSSGETFDARLERYRTEERRHFKNLAAACVVALVALAALLLLPLLIYALGRIIRLTPPLEGDAAQIDRLRRQARLIGLWWALGLAIPVAGVATAALVVQHSLGPWVALALGGGGYVLCLVMQLIWVVRLRRNPAAADAPLWRKVLTPLPAAYLLAAAVVPCLVAATSYPRAMDEITGVILALALAGTMMLAFGAVATASHSLVRRCSRLRLAAGWLWRLGLLASPALALPLLLVASKGMAPPMAAMALQAEVALDRAERFMSLKKPADADDDRAGEDGAATARVRRHFPETLIWRPEIITDAQGRASVPIPLADSITTWRLSLSAVSAAGELGATVKSLRVFQPFFVDLDLPVALTQNDRVQLPVAIYNYLDRSQAVRLELAPGAWYRLAGGSTQTVRLEPNKVGATTFTLIALRPGQHKLTLRAAGSEGVADAVERVVRVEPDGKAVAREISAQLSPGQPASQTFDIPAGAIAGASDLLVKLHPGAFSQVVEGLDNIFAMPSGCFEQTSSATYPNVLVLDYMRRTRQIKPEVELKALKYINLGNQRLLSYEVPGGGFEWFGHAPAHNVLTAYGLMEFADMARVYDQVDRAVIERTRRWLLSQQRNDGSWIPSSGGIAEGAINAYQDQRLRTTAYIAWALAESGERDRPEPGLIRALDLVAREVGQEQDPYTLAVAANALVAAGRPEARRALAKLSGLKQEAPKGQGITWKPTSQGVTFSLGHVLQIETTALAAYAYLKAGADVAVAHRALAWLISQKDSRGTWHSTQATVLALRALLLGTGSATKLAGPVRVTVGANGQTVRTVTITPQTSDVLQLVSLRHLVRPGDNTVTLSSAGARGELSYQIVATHHVPWSAGERPGERPAAPGPLSIDVAYDSTRLRTNALLTSKVTVAYNQPGAADMLIVDLGLPPGFAVEAGTFDALVERGVIERYTLTGGQATLYIRRLAAGKPLSFSYGLRAKHPVQVKTPGARVYEYYQPEVKAQSQPVQLTVL